MLLNPSSEYEVLVTVFSCAVYEVYKWMLISYTSKIIYCLLVQALIPLFRVYSEVVSEENYQL